MGTWFEDEGFWERFHPILFGPERWENAAKEIDAVMELTGFPEGGHILDLCCGPGRHSLELARRGMCVTAVDRTKRYLDEARRKAAEEKLDVEFVLEDMRSFRRPETFNGAINMFTSFGYFADPDDDRRVAQNLHDSMKPGGAVIMDLIGREVIAKRFRERDWYPLDDPEGGIMLEERKLSQNWGWIESTWTLIDGSKRTIHTIAHRPYTGTELAALLKSVGFSEVEIYGTLEGEAYDQDAKRLLAVARKTA